nr:hypothetical protein [Bacillaceae bacterium]
MKPQSVTVAVFGTGLPQAGIEGAGTGKIPGLSKGGAVFSTRIISGNAKASGHCEKNLGMVSYFLDLLHTG